MASVGLASLRALGLTNKMERPLLLPSCCPRASCFPLASPLKLLPVGRTGARCSAPSSQGNVQLDAASSASSGSYVQERSQDFARLTVLDPWDPFYWSTRSLRQMMETLDMVFGDAWGPTTNTVSFTRAPWDVVENDDNYEMRIDLPGFEKDEVKAHLDDGVLVVNAETKKEQDDENKGKRSLRTRGYYRTKINLPKNCDTSKLSAKLHNGVLAIHIPKGKAPDHLIEVKVD